MKTIKKYSRPEKTRLNDPKSYQAVFKDPFRSGSTYFTVLAIRNSEATARLGLIVAKRHIKRAVGRNYIKRVIRESFRHHKEILDGLDLVVLLKRKPDEQFTGRVIFKCLEKHWDQLAGFLKSC